MYSLIKYIKNVQGFIDASNTSNIRNTLLKKVNDPTDDVKGGVKEISERQRIILELIIANLYLSEKAISEKIS